MAYALLSTRNTSGLHPNLRGLGFLGDSNPTLTAEAAFQKALSAYSGQHVNPRDSGNSAWISANERQIAAGQLDPATGCSGQSPNLNLFQTASGVALGTTGATVGILGPSGTGLIPAAAVPVIGWVIAGAGAIIGLISAIFQHHAAAVKRDANFYCAAVGGVNNAFNVIKTAVQNGTMKPSDAANALPEIYSQMMAAGGASGSSSGPGSIPSGGAPINNHPYCNSVCELSICVLGMVFYWQAQFQSMVSQQAAAESQGVQSSQGGSQISEVLPGSPVAPSGFSAVPGWAWLIGAAFAAWAVL
jgi:hypothetical protein